MIASPPTRRTRFGKRNQALHGPRIAYGKDEVVQFLRVFFRMPLRGWHQPEMRLAVEFFGIAGLTRVDAAVAAS